MLFTISSNLAPPAFQPFSERSDSKVTQLQQSMELAVKW